MQPITIKKVYRIKKRPSSKLQKVKARIVARGFQHTKSINYGEIFILVVWWFTNRIIFELAAKYN